MNNIPVTKGKKWVLSQREIERLRKSKFTTDLAWPTFKERVKARKVKRLEPLWLEIKVLVGLIILAVLIIYTVQVYWDIETTPTPKIQQIDTLEQVLQDNPEIKSLIEPEVKQVAEVKTTKEYLEKADSIYTKEYRQQMQGLNIYMTSYNAEVWQTDSTPCIAWWTGVNVCEAEKEWRRIIALSQELTAWSTIWKVRKKMNCWFNCITFEAREKVNLEQTMESIKKQGYNPRCNWEFEVSDAMNVRYRKRWDLFFSDRKQNTSCEVKIYKLK